MCPWANRYLVLQNILINQLEWPYLPGSSVYVKDGNIGPFGNSKNTDAGSGQTYEDAQIDLTFETANKQEGNANFQESLEPAAEFLQLPYQSFRWGAGDGTALKKEEAPGRLEIGLDYCVTWSNLISIPAQALSLIGCVNQNVVTSRSLGLTFAAETLLFNPPKISRSVVIGKINRYQMSCKFTYRRSGWNSFWRADAGAVGSYAEIYKADEATPYKNYTVTPFINVVP
jgi:hypothetical protein